MKVVIYSKGARHDIARITMAYCQRWDCYPSIEQYSQREEVFDAIKNQSVDIAILQGNRQECDSIVEQIEKMGIRLNFIWISIEDFQETNHQQANCKKHQYSDMLTKKVEKGLESCGIPSSKESLCRVHLSK